MALGGCVLLAAPRGACVVAACAVAGSRASAPRGLSVPQRPHLLRPLWLAGECSHWSSGPRTGPASRTALRLMYIFFLKCSLPFLKLSLVFSLAHRS